jgi:hypothetical protein
VVLYTRISILVYIDLRLELNLDPCPLESQLSRADPCNKGFTIKAPPIIPPMTTHANTPPQVGAYRVLMPHLSNEL